MLGGYMGKVLFVDLTDGSIKEELLPESIYRDFVGGIGLGVRVLYERMKPKVDPLGPDNMLGFLTGPLTGTPVPTSGRYTVVTKSPLTDAWADSNSGGSLGPELKSAGYDAVFFSGASAKPVYLLLSSDKAEIRDASHLWGKNTAETEDSLRVELGDSRVRIACIGPSGESQSLIAGIVTEKGRVAARAGVGAVMGSKNLKAMAVKGNRKVPIAKPEKVRSVKRDYLKILQSSPFQRNLTALGTSADVSHLVAIGDCPIKNWRLFGNEAMPTCSGLDSDKMEKYKVRKYGCHGCAVACGAILRVREGPFAGNEVHRPEYETAAALGTLCLNDNVESIIRANEICDLYGIDTISAGTTIAFAMECYERGIIGKKETDGIDLTWGNTAATIALLEKIARREGFGEALADGVRKAAERIGRGSEEYAVHVHGQELAMHDSRLNPARGAGYVIDANPGHHSLSSPAGTLEQGKSLGSDPALQAPKSAIYGDYDKKGQTYSIGFNYFQLLSNSGLCSLAALFIAVPVAEFIAAVTGWNFGWAEGLAAGQRAMTLRQAFNAREGLLPENFRLPRRVVEPVPAGLAAGVHIDYDALKKGYFKAMGWDLKTGKPYPKALVDLGLQELTRDLAEC